LNERREARQLATILAPVVLDAMKLEEPPDPRWIQVLPLNDELIVIPVVHEARHLARKILPPATVAQVAGEEGSSEQQMRYVQEALESTLAETGCPYRAFLWLLLTADHRAYKQLLHRGARSPRQGGAPSPERVDPSERDEGRARRRLHKAAIRLFHRQDAGLTRPRLMAAWVSRQAVACILNGVIAIVVGVSLLHSFGWDLSRWWNVGLLKFFAIWAMSFLPGWLFVRFLGQRARALWWDFVLALHRLGLDQPQFLPEPPLNSQYHRLWREAGGSPLRNCESIYRDKFDAYYGKQVSRIGAEEETTRIWSETLFPVILLTAVLAVGWTAVLWNTSFISSPGAPADILKFGFLGAYSFIIQLLIRRYFQNDLRASAYASAVVRIFVVTIIVAVLHQVPGLRDKPLEEAVVAFVVGFFPIVGMQALQRLTATLLRQVVPSLNSAYPLNQIDGLNVWYEARLLEEGIEDMQNLTTTNLVDVLLHTHVPVGRLVDWIDQAHLYQRLDRTELNRKERRKATKSMECNGTPGGAQPVATGQGGRRKRPVKNVVLEDSEGSRFGTKERHALRRLGIRTATDLLKVMPLPLTQDDRDWLTTRELDSYAMDKLVTGLRKEPGLRVIWRWQQGVDADFPGEPIGVAPCGDPGDTPGSQSGPVATP